MSEAVVVQLPFRPQGPTPVAQRGAVTQSFSSFGLDHTTVGPEFDVQGLVDSPRVRELEYRSRFFTCTQHDWKTFDFNGRMIAAGRQGITQPFIGGSSPSFYVPLDQRRPTAPYRIGRKIVSSFTWLLFGHGRFPQVRSEDPDTQDFATELIHAANLEVKLQQARNIGGSCGSVGISWAFREGRPCCTVHAGKNIHVLEWEDEEERVPAHVVELVVLTKTVRDPRSGKLTQSKYWRRKDWTKVADVVFQVCEVTNQNTGWVIDEQESYAHQDGRCHFIFIENVPDDEESTYDGMPDYAETYEQQNALDTVNSVVVRGGILNLDPTLKLKMDREAIGSAVIQKGSENALCVGETGDATYLEISGTSLTAGLSLIQDLRSQILETCEAVIPDPNQVAAAGLSSVALKMLYAPSLGKTDLLRHQYGKALERLLVQMIEFARGLMPSRGDAPPEEKYVYEVELDEQGEEVAREPVEYVLNLAPRVEPYVNEAGEVTEEVVFVERHPGNGTIALEWGPYFKPTADDISKEAGVLVNATGGKPVCSQQTAVERLANLLDRDATEEWKRVQDEQAAAAVSETFMPEPGFDMAPEDATPVEGAPLLADAPSMTDPMEAGE